MTLAMCPQPKRVVAEFIREHHRHHEPPITWIVHCACCLDGRLVGVATANRPVNVSLCDGVTLEISRTCTTGERNANSMLMGAIGRIGKALGYSRLITYTLPEEGGASLRAAGFVVAAHVPPDRFRANHKRPGHRAYPLTAKLRWERVLS
jgi:hypothetical protein